uniref:ParB family protein n=1 Tax=Burkholderia arboris TaxID=488730 RepID=UPI003BEEDBE1
MNGYDSQPVTHETPTGVPDGFDTSGAQPADVAGDGTITLHVTQIRPYERNPRRERNPAYLEMKASIRATRRLVVRLSVTQRPGDSHYILAAGGNTRLAILQELWEETRDDAFGLQQVFVVPWVSEKHIYAAHLIENGKRADISFWDRASGCAVLRSEIEAEAGESLSIRKLVQAFEQEGFAVGRSMLHQYDFAIAYLEPINRWLTNDNVKQLQPMIGEWVRLASVFEIDSEQLRDEVILPTLQSYAFSLSNNEVGATVSAFNVRVIGEQLQAAVAARLSAPTDVLAVWVDMQRNRADVTRDDLLSYLQAIQSGQGRHWTQPSPAVHRHPVQDGQATAPAAAEPGQAPHVRNEGSVDVLVTRALELARSLAASLDCAEMVVASEGTPAGFYVELGQATWVDCPDPYLRDALWWTLAQLSGQLYSDVLLGLPEYSSWRRTMGSATHAGLNQPEIDSLLYQSQARFDTVTRQPLIFADYLPLVLFHQRGLVADFSALIETVAKLQQVAPERFSFARQYLFQVKEAS